MLRQIDDDRFALQERLVVTWPPGPEGSTLVIEPGWLARTDLASVPGYLGWFARRHGRHTPAALVHDLLVGRDESEPPPTLPAPWRLAPPEADQRFRQLLVASGVPPVRAYLMWTAVVASTRWRTAGPRLALLLWGAAAAAGSAMFVWGLAAQVWWAVAAGLVAPALASALWGSQYAAGVIAGYSLWWAVAGSLPAWLAYRAYHLVEWVVFLARARRVSGREVPAARAPEPPVRYDAR